MKDAETGAGVLGGAPEYRETIIILLDGLNYAATVSSNCKHLRAPTDGNARLRWGLYVFECGGYDRSRSAMRKR